MGQLHGALAPLRGIDPNLEKAATALSDAIVSLLEGTVAEETLTFGQGEYDFVFVLQSAPPTLGITTVSSMPVMVWPASATNYVLQMTTNLASGSMPDCKPGRVPRAPAAPGGNINIDRLPNSWRRRK